MKAQNAKAQNVHIKNGLKLYSCSKQIIVSSFMHLIYSHKCNYV